LRYRLRTLPSLRLHIARAFIAAILILVLLGGVAPLSTLSATAVCTMECCVGLPPHGAGSCHMKMSAGTPGPDAKKLSGIAEAIDEVTGGVMGMETSHSFDAVTIDASEHCHRKSTAEGERVPSRNDLSAQASPAAQSLTKPCPPECGTGVMGFAQLQRSRDSAALAHAMRPRPPTIARQSRSIEADLFNATALPERIRPRGPPCFS
jgi:hypothetical protein